MNFFSILVGDVLESLRKLPDESVHCVVTSPPYWGLRDYGVEGQIGLEPTPAEFVAKMVEVFREVRRVLRSDGTCWMNMGDSYNAGTSAKRKAPKTGVDVGGWNDAEIDGGARIGFPGLKPKDLCGMPWRVALALQEDGWWLRQDIIWSKPNPMPESINDRCTKAHEYIFLLTKKEKYFYDAEAIKEAVSGTANSRGSGVNPKVAAPSSGIKQNSSFSSAVTGLVESRNKRSVWEITTEAFPEAHFATFPTKLVEPCILAGTSEKGCCAKCGAPWKRVMEAVDTGKTQKMTDGWAVGNYAHGTFLEEGRRKGEPGKPVMAMKTVGWKPGCACEGKTVPCRVLDPFSGSGTTGLVALRHGRSYLGCELNPEYAEMSRDRLYGDNPMFNVEIVAEENDACFFTQNCVKGIEMR